MADPVSEVIENIVRAREVIESVVGAPIPEDVLRRVLEEVEHIGIHELAHGALRVVYPGIDRVWHENPVLGECVDEVSARVIERYVSESIGSYTHDYEEHAHELRHYRNLADLNIRGEDLERLYSGVSDALKEGRLIDVVRGVERACREWISRSAGSTP